MHTNKKSQKKNNNHYTQHLKQLQEQQEKLRDGGKHEKNFM